MKSHTIQPGATLGVFGGGLLGLALGYYALNFFFGARFDFLKVYLPGVPHTEKHRSESVDPDDGGEAEQWVPVDHGDMPAPDVTGTPNDFDFQAAIPNAFTDPIDSRGPFSGEEPVQLVLGGPALTISGQVHARNGKHITSSITVIMSPQRATCWTIAITALRRKLKATRKSHNLSFMILRFSVSFCHGEKRG